MRSIVDEKSVTESVDELEAFAQRLIDEFWEENEERRYTEDAGVLGVRIRHEHESKWFRIVWYWNRFVRKSEDDAKKQIYSNEISKPRGSYRYNLNSFRKGRAWERALAAEMEARFEEIRKAQDMLKEAGKAQRAFWRAAEKGLKPIDASVREQLPKDAGKDSDKGG